MTLDAIKEAIQHLSEDDRHNLVDWFEEMEDAAWDGEIVRDFSPGGRGEGFLKELRQEATGGHAQSLSQGLAKRHKPVP
jgi:hypothetical protein